MANQDPNQRKSRTADLLSQIPMDTDKQAPAPDGSQNSPLNNDFARNVGNIATALPGVRAVPGAVGAGATIVGRAAQAAAPAVATAGRAAQAVGPYAPVIGGAAALASGAGANSQQSAPVPASSPAAAPAPAGYNYQSTGEMGPPDLSGVAGGPSKTVSDVTRIGNSYSGANVAGNITVNGQAPGGGYMEGSGGGSLVQRALSQPSAPEAPQFNAPQVAHSGNDWAARKQLENLATSASSITNNGGRFDSRRGSSTSSRPLGASLAQEAYHDALRADLAAQGQQPGLENSTNQINSNLQREGMQQAGLQQRSQAQIALSQQRLGMDAETQGYANRAAAQQEQLRSALVDPKSTPEQRKSARDALMTLSGRSDADPYLVVPGGQQVDQMGKAYSMPSSVFNRQTGQFVQQQGQSQQPQFEKGKVYVNANGERARYNGTGWEPA